MFRPAGVVGWLAVSLALLGSPVITTSLGGAAHAADDTESTRRQGVIALASAISAVGQTPELATPLPFTTTSLADVLDLDEKLTTGVASAMTGTSNLAAALDAVPGVHVSSDDPNRIVFTYSRSVDDFTLPLVHDDGDLRFGENPGAGTLAVSLTTDPTHPFVVQVDPNQTDPLLKVALVSQPQMDLSVDIETNTLDPFSARQGFTQVRVTGGHYKIHRDQHITMRDPDGRSLLTLEDLRYSTLPDLFRITTADSDSIDVGLDLALPASLTSGDGRTGTLSVDGASAPDAVWPSAADARRKYGDALKQATDLTMVDGLTGLAQYTGTALALQDAANVDFPNLGGGTSDLFAPGDRLLDLLSSAAAAQVQCGAAPQIPPAGVAAPGDTVYCMAKTADGLGKLSDVQWSVKDGSGEVVESDSDPTGALGPDPTGLVRIDGSDGEPDVQVSFKAGDKPMVARSMPHTVQDVTRRIAELGGGTSATASLSAGRLDVAVDIEQGTHSEDLPLGNADGLGALVGLTGLKSPGGEEATATATGASFQAGFGIQTGTPAAGKSRQTYLLPGAGGDVLTIQGLSASAPKIAGMAARVGFLKVKADLGDLDLGQTSGKDAVTLKAANADAISFSDLLNQDGALNSDAVKLSNEVTADIGFTAHEVAMSGGSYASNVPGGASGTATVSWTPAGLPKVGFSDGYGKLRVFDPAPAVFLAGRAHVTTGSPDSVRVDVTNLAGKTLYQALGVAAPATGQPDPEVARRLLAGGPSCQTVTVVDDDSFTCTGLAPRGVAAYGDGDHVEAIVLGDPFALRNSVIEGLATALASFNRIDSDNVSGDGLTDDQYTSTLPLVDLRPAQLAVERDGLTDGLAQLSQAATEDEQVDRHRPAGLPSVSSAQELEDAIGTLMGDYPATLQYTLGSGDLGVSLSAQTQSGQDLQAPLRLMVTNPGQVVTDRTYKVGVDSSTTLAIDVDVASARAALARGTGTTSTATLDLPSGGVIAGPMQAGVGTATVKSDSGSTALLGVTVDTTYNPTTGAFETKRTNARSGKGASDPAALATLVSDQGTLQYSAKATDSSGGAGASQPKRQPMQVQYLAEGLDGLATALGEATDGAAPRNIGPNGAPISAPLIGTDLDAGAGVSDTLTSLTSRLRDELGAGTDVAKAADSAALTKALEAAMKAAVGKTEHLDPATDVLASVSCGGTAGACKPCAPPAAGDTDPKPCATETSTGWDVVTLSATLHGTEKTGEAPFETGLAGMALHSDKKIATTTKWSLPVTLRLTRGVGPQVVINPGDHLETEVHASIPDGGIDAVVGYLPAHIEKTSDGSDDLHTLIELGLSAPGASAPQAFDLFDLYDGKLTSTPSFSDPDTGDNGDDWKDGLSLDFETYDAGGALHLKGTILMPWTAAGGFGDVSYDGVALDVGKVVSTMATPFKVIDPYLAPVRDVIDVLRTPIPVVSDLSELAGGDEVSLLSILENLSKDRPKLDLAYRVIGMVDGVTKLNKAISTFSDKWVDLNDASDAAAVLTLEAKDVAAYDKCTETINTTTSSAAGSTTRSTKPAPCPDEDSLETEKEKNKSVAGQTTQENRTGKRKIKTSVAQKTKSVTGSVPGFSMPFLEDPDQILDVLTGSGEATYFRVDFGTLAASVAYTKRFGPIMAGPVPIVPFVGGSISIEGRLAMGFDSHAQTLAFESLGDQGDVDALRKAYKKFDGGDVLREGFYLDDLDSEGEDVPEVKLVTTLEAGAGVSIGIVSAGLKGSITLTINVDLNDPNDDGKLRTAEIRDRFGSDPLCAFEVDANIEASITIFVEIELLIETLEYEFDILRLGPYQLFHYGCPDQLPTLVERDGTSDHLALTSGSRTSDRHAGPTEDSVDEYEVRQFDTNGGAAGGKSGGSTTYEVGALGRVQRVEVTPNDGGGFHVKIYQAGEALSTTLASQFDTGTAPTFVADGGAADDKISFLTGETFNDKAALVSTPFSTDVTSLTGGADNDTLVTGAGNDTVSGESGADSIQTGAGNDVADGGSENDVIGGGAGNDDLNGGTGDDHLEGGAGADRAVGGDGNDSLQGGPGRDVRAVLIAPTGTSYEESVPAPQEVTDQVLAGFDSGDVLVGGPGADTVDGGDGSDVVVGGDAGALTGDFGPLFTSDGDRAVNVIVRDGDGNVHTKHVKVPTADVPDPKVLDTLCTSGDALAGSANSDFVTGGPEADVVVGGNGPDRLDGGAGPDEICGRAAADQISGDGAQTKDSPSVGSSVDVIRGGTGDDQADGGPGNDVMYGDDVDLVRGGVRHLDGSLGDTASGAGRDYLQGGDGSDVLAGEDGSDLLIGGAGDDQAFGEGSDTPETGAGSPSVADRLLACNPTTRVIDGKIDLNGDLLAGAGGSGVVADSGQVAGLRVVDGEINGLGSNDPLDGLLAGDVVVIGGLVDLDHNGVAGTGDTGMIPFASMLNITGSNDDGDCILAGDGNDELKGGKGSDYLGAGDGTDLASGGDGNDLILGDGGTDVLLGGPHSDVLVGGLGDDRLQGGNGDDRLRGNEGADDLIGGSATSGAKDGEDVLLGGRDTDVLVAENGSLYSPAINTAVDNSAVPWRTDGDVPADVKATSAPSFDSAIGCAQDAPTRWLTLLEGDGAGIVGTSSPGVDDSDAYDELYGGFGCDFVFGSEGNDVVRGGQDADMVEGGPGADYAYGDDGEDVVIGGSSYDPKTDTPYSVTRTGGSVAEDAGDTIHGDHGADSKDGSDLVMGDNALPTRLAAPDDQPGPDYTVQLLGGSGADTIDTGKADDRVFGQGGNDTVDAGDDNDYVEGNEGQDTLNGQAGDDDLIGGSSAANGLPLGTEGTRLLAELSAAPYDSSAAGVQDASDTIDGGTGADMVLGDNGRITRPANRGRDIALTQETAAGTSGDDTLNGGDQDDRLFGQDGTDTIHGDQGADYAEGNAGLDWVYGDSGADTVIGGSSVSPAGDGTLGSLPTVAFSDAGDWLYGDNTDTSVVGNDLILGDNATVLPGTSGPVVQLAQVPNGAVAPAGTSGGDHINGGGAPTGAGAGDQVFGQGGDDIINTGAALDYVEGNDGRDLISAGDGDDMVIGGSSANNGRPLGDAGSRLRQQMPSLVESGAAGVYDDADTIHGDGGDDAVLGDNGRITRPAGWTKPDVAMADLGGANQLTYGSDQLYGDDGNDDLYGQLDDGSALGSGDWLEGGEGRDSIVGDLAVVDRVTAASLGETRARQVALNSDAIVENLYPQTEDVLTALVPSGQATVGGPDVALGGGGNDIIRMGGGRDVANGNAGDDVVLGGDADDTLWGGVGHDRIFGGYGDDDMDLKRRSGDPALFNSLRETADGDGTESTNNGADMIYGGWGADEMQVDVGGAGKSDTASDHVVDWVGVHNVYYVCGGAYGAGRIIRQQSPAMVDLLNQLVLAAGDRDVATSGSGGFYDLGLVDKANNQNNSPSPEAPGHFTCG